MAVDEYEVVGDSLRVRVARDGSERIIALHGALRASNARIVYRRLSEALNERGIRSVVLDLRELDAAEAQGISAIAAALPPDGGDHRLRVIPGPAPGVRRLIADARIPISDR